MRIAGGDAKGRALLSANGRGLRPTSAKVRAAIFSVLENT
ncbi:MAG: 16S rRNA (guanine(966)-N(2))-methyltransferase RsmD, partial [Dehalococcoidia bacterium]|nr:16S rRNA (guanine(966)-N(2))-methyltransferase RsmD [Dehalococcoidia bacterium]